MDSDNFPKVSSEGESRDEVHKPERSQRNEKVAEVNQETKTGKAVGWSSEEFEKLVLAKKQLNGIISLTNSLKQSHNWD